MVVKIKNNHLVVQIYSGFSLLDFIKQRGLLRFDRSVYNFCDSKELIASVM
jgi:hypothetical protein